MQILSNVLLLFQIPGICDQLCTNLNASYSCGCTLGYDLVGRNSCKAVNVPSGEEATLLFANSINIQHVFFNGTSVTTPVKTRETLALDFNHRNRSLCWVAHGKKAASHLRCSSVDGLGDGVMAWTLPDPELYSLDSVNQIAFDWSSSNWYLLDDTKELILLCTEADGAALLCKSVVSVHISKPRGIALDPEKGYMFFTVWGSDTAKVERSALDGQERHTVVDSKIVYPYGITVDFANEHIYWVDTYLDYIERCDYAGQNRKTVLRGSPVQNLYSIDLFENSLFITSWRENSVLRVGKFDPEENRTTILEGLERPFAVRVFHRQKQPLNRKSHHPCECPEVRFPLFQRATKNNIFS